jgi:hypothetical protein
MRKTIMPEDPKQKIIIWKDQLKNVENAQKEIIVEKIKVNNEEINLRLRVIAGENLDNEMAACKKKEIDMRIAELTAKLQRERLEEAIRNYE